MVRRTLFLVAASMPMLACSASLRRGVTTTEAATRMEQVTRSRTNELDPAVSPDGKSIAFEVADSLESPPHVEGMQLKDVGSDERARIAYGPRNVMGREPAWMPDSSGLVFLSGAGDSRRLVQTFGPSPDRTTFLADAGNPNLHGTWPSISPDGQRVVTSLPQLDEFRTGWRRDLSFDAALGVSDLSGSGLTVLGEGTSPSWSPHGHRLAFARKGEGGAHIFVANADGTAPVQLTDGPEDDVEPAWSPDGKSLAFCSVQVSADGTSHSNIFVVHADGSGLEQLTEGDRSACRPAWAPDGFIYFHADATDRFHIWRIQPIAAGVAGRAAELTSP